VAAVSAATSLYSGDLCGTDFPMKVLYVIGSMEVGGAEQHLLRVAVALRERGYKPEVFTLTPGGPLTRSFLENNVPVHGVRLPELLTRALRHDRILAWAGLMYSAAALWWLYWRKRPQIVHFFLPAAYIVGGVVSLFAPPIVRVMSRRSLNLYQAKHRLFRRIEHGLHPRMDIVCGNSKAVIEDLKAEGIPPSRLRLIYNGIPLDRFDKCRSPNHIRSELQIGDDTLVLVMVANLIPYKGHADLIDALGLIKNRLPPNWVLLCIGRDDGIRERLETRAHASGLQAHVRFLGSRVDVPDLLCAADIGVLCSHEEGFSNAILEGMAARLPMIVTNVGGNAEAVIHGDTGLVVPARDPEALAAALLSVALNPDRGVMGVRGRTRVTALFSMQACVGAYSDLYQELLRQ